jgi:serine/threonine-protein kinase
MAETRDRMQRMNMARFREIKPIRTLVPELPPVVEAIVTKSMELDPNKRYGKPVEMLIDLQKAIKQMESSAAAPDATEEVSEGDSKTVLLVESNSAIQDALREGLKKYGYRVLVISDPQRALQRFQDDPRFADVAIISTVALGQHALEMFRQHMAAHPTTANLPTILLLGKSQAKVQQRLSLQEHQAVVTMPLRLMDLRRVLRDLLAPAQADRQA